MNNTTVVECESDHTRRKYRLLGGLHSPSLTTAVPTLHSKNVVRQNLEVFKLSSFIQTELHTRQNFIAFN